jgi:hypothetical protein
VTASGGLSLASTLNGSVADERLGTSVSISSSHVLATTRNPSLPDGGFAMTLN